MIARRRFDTMILNAAYFSGFDEFQKRRYLSNSFGPSVLGEFILLRITFADY